MFDEIKTAVGHSWDILFETDKGIVIKFLAFIQAHPVLLLPLGFYLVILGIKTTRKMITGV